jgi:hypothetical protein
LSVGDLVHVKGHNKLKGVVLEYIKRTHSKPYCCCKIYWFNSPNETNYVPISILVKIDVSKQ